MTRSISSLLALRTALCGLLVALLAACAAAEDSVSPLSTPASISETTWLQTKTAGIELGLWKPAGWAADTTGGLALVEQVSPVNNNPAAMEGVVVNFFFPDLGNFEMDAASQNHAMDIMTQAAVLPEVRQSAIAISEPASFAWRDHDAAYYLLTGRGDTRTLVIGIFLPEKDKLLAINISMPSGEVSAVRDRLPALFADFMIDGIELDGADLDNLPNPLVFPSADDSA